MNKEKITRFLQSFVAIPLLAIGTPISGVATLPTIAMSPQQVLVSNSAEDASAITTKEAEIRAQRAEAIDTFLASYNSPLVGYGMKFVIEAEAHDLDWRLLVAIAGRESTFGKNSCKRVTHSFLGYGSCKMNFKSIDESIEKVSESLGGNNKNTAHYYQGKNTLQILRKYNSVIPNYPKEVVRIMKMIENSEVI